MSDLMLVDPIQQLEVALLGLPAAEVVDLLSTGLSKSKPATLTTAQPHPHTSPAIPPASLPVSFPAMGVSESPFNSCHGGNRVQTR